MKTKTGTYILIAAVLCVWGIIGYKILSAVNPTSPEIAQQHFEASFGPRPSTEVDTFSIQILERDPFLGTLYIKKETKQKKARAKEPIVWLPIRYHGNIANQSSKAKVFIVSIDNVQHLMRLGQAIKGIKLIRGNDNSVMLRYKGTRKTIIKT